LLQVAAEEPRRDVEANTAGLVTEVSASFNDSSGLSGRGAGGGARPVFRARWGAAEASLPDRQQGS